MGVWVQVPPQAMKCIPLILLLSISGCGPTKIVDKVDNIPVLMRSPQPDGDDLIELQSEYGVKTIINLRAPQVADWYVEEKLTAAQLGIDVIHIPVSSTRGPTQEQLEKFFNIVDDKDRWPILIHCQGGIHRTGIMVAYYRMKYDRWDPYQAVDEMRDNWFEWGITDRSRAKCNIYLYRD